MEAYANVLLIAIPGFIVLIIIEWLASLWLGKKVYRPMDTIASLSSGLTNTLKSILGLVLIIISYGWVVERVALIHIEATWLVYLTCFIAIDFGGYWSHRLNHSINYFWNIHVIHHSSEEFNLSTALRQTIANFFALGFIFLLPAALLGIPEQVIAVVAPLHLFAQFWYHTRLVPKLGFLEYLIITPSQHRVHHAINDIYLDKNMGQIFPWWDRMFGTFQEELPEVPCVYGVKRAVRTWNPIRINFQHLWLLAQDAWRTQSWWDKLRIWFMPTGWRPADVIEKYPVEVIADPYAYEKYAPQLSRPIQIWTWFQFILTNTLILHMLMNFAAIGFPAMFYYSGFIFLLIYSYTSLMDLNPNAIWFELIKSVYGISLIYHFGTWFNMDTLLPGMTLFMTIYMLLSVMVVGGFVVKKVRTNENSLTTA